MEVLTEDTLDKLVKDKREGRLEEVPFDFESLARQYVKDMQHWPDTHWEACDIDKQTAIKQAQFKINYLTEGKI